MNNKKIKNIDLGNHYHKLYNNIDSLKILFKNEFDDLISKWIKDESVSIDTQRYFAKFLQTFPNKVSTKAKAFEKHLEGDSKK